jgi:hypothetical protein
MDGISSAASVISVIQLTGSIVKICGGYIQEMKEARGEIISLQQHVAGLTGILEKLLELFCRTPGTEPSTAQTMVNATTECLAMLGVLKKKIDPGGKGKAMSKLGLRALKWPLKRAEVDKVIRDIERYKSLFTLSLQVDQMCVLGSFDYRTSLTYA